MNFVFSGGGGMGYGGMGPGPPMPGVGGAPGMQNMAGTAGSRFPSPGMPQTKQALQEYMRAAFFMNTFYYLI